MHYQRAFRFSATCPSVTSGAELASFAQMAESVGYSSVVTGEHVAFGTLGPIATLTAAATATTTIRLISHVFNNELRHPALLAQEMATLDLLSEGRLELGIGAGWLRFDHDMLGLPFDPPAARVARLEEAVRLIKQLFGDEPTTFEGQFYHVSGLNLLPKPAQRPHPPLFIGGGGRRILSFAAREANIIGLDPKGTTEGGKDAATTTAEAFDQKVAWVREAAGERFEEIELHVLALGAMITDDRRRGAEQIAAVFASFPPGVVQNPVSDVDVLLASPQILIGTVEQICADLEERRARYGISYITIPAESVEAFAPVVERLTGK